jgi:hypothetical protein
MMANQQDLDSQAVDVVRKLLGIASFNNLVSFLLERCNLPNGGFESHEFGKLEHSTSSGAAVLSGVSGIRAVPDGVVEPIVAAISALIADSGRVRGHDNSPESPDTSWRTAQILCALLSRPSLSQAIKAKLGALVCQLAKSQDVASGGWSLRHDEDPQLLFAFYPALALARTWQLGMLDSDEGSALLSRTGRYLAEQIRTGDASLEEQLLAVRALRAIRSAWSMLDEIVPDIHEFQSTIDQRTWTTSEGVRLVDRPIVVYRQPIWYSIIWRPLLYLAVRGSSPTSPLQALLGHELVSTFNREVSGWHGPSGASSAPQGVSWASALALRTTYALAQDLLRFGITAEEWLRRSRDLADMQYDFDVAISFAGSDRTVASQISDELKRAGYRVFYDRDYQHALLGEDLTAYLQQTYSRRSRFAIVIISTAFKESKWAGQWEWKAVLARMQDQQGAYLLPYIVEDIDLPGFNRTIGYVSHTDYTPIQFADLVIRKLREAG